MSYSNIILKDRPDIVWPLDNITDSSSVSNAINFFNSTPSQYAASINTSVSNVIDIPIIYGGGTALRITSSATAGLSIPLLNRFSEVYSGKESSIEFWLRCDKSVPHEITLIKKRNFNNIGLFLKENYLIFRYGTSSSFIEASFGVAELDEPTHIVMNVFRDSIELIVDGQNVKSTNFNNISFPVDASHSSNDYMDFYGSSEYNVIFDGIAIYPNAITTDIAKRHYVYGLGKSIPESIFFNLGGDFYNLSTVLTRKSHFAYWNSPGDWQLTRYNNLINTENGITVPPIPSPTLYSYDNNITKTSNRIAFFSGSNNTAATHIDIDGSILTSDNRPFFAKVILDGTLPSLDNYQTIMSYSRRPFNELLNFNLKNSSGSYYAQFDAVGTTYSASFYIPNITSSPTVYIGMRYDSESVLYFGLSGSPLYSASFNYYTASTYSLDPLTTNFPADSDTTIRVGGRYTYDSDSDIINTTDINQFNGTFLKFMLTNESFSGSTVAELDAYTESPYSVSYDSLDQKLKVYSFGNANFFIHGSRIAESDISGSAFISSNKIKFGYPDVLSGSQVKLYATLLDYDNNTIYPKTQLSKLNHLEWLNLKDISQAYLRFDIDMYSNDSLNQPPFITYFTFEAYPLSGSYTEILDDGGDTIKIRSSASAHINLPDEDLSPTIFINDSSGIKVYRNYVDIEFSPVPRSLNPNAYSNIKLWLDSRLVNGRVSSNPTDSANISLWSNISTNDVSASLISTFTPEYRIQSLNLLKDNQSNGGENGTASGVVANNHSEVVNSVDGAVSGISSFKIIPKGTNKDSFISVDNTTASAIMGVVPNKTYTVLATVTLTKPQESTDLHPNARSIAFSQNLSSGSAIENISNQAPNQIGSHSVSVSFTTSSGMQSELLNLYNGSASPSDIVYYDNIAVYSGSGNVSGSPVQWYSPYQHADDRQIVSFTGSSAYSVTQPIAQPLTAYFVARSFADGGILGGHAASAPSIYVSSGSYVMGAGANIVGPTTGQSFDIITAVFNNNSSSLFVNNNVYTGSVGSGSFNPSGITIGRSIIGASSSSFFNGQVAGVLVYAEAHNKATIDEIKQYLTDSFGIQ